MLAAVGTAAGLSLVSKPFDGSSSLSALRTPLSSLPFPRTISGRQHRSRATCVVSKLAPSGSSSGSSVEQGGDSLRNTAPKTVPGDEDPRQVRRSADWRAARAYKDSGVLFDGKIEAFNNGGLLIRFYSLLGFLPYPLLGPSHTCKDSSKTIQDIARDLVGSSISLKVLEVNEEEKKLIFSEKDAVWTKYSSHVNVGDVFDGKVASLEDYGAFVHLRFPDGYYYLTGLVHVSEVSWDLVQDVRDFLNEGDQVKVKVIQIDREKARISLSIKQLEDDPLMERLDKVIPQEGQLISDSHRVPSSMTIEPLPGLETICKELLQEDGITDVQLGRQGLEKRVVSQDLELWLSNVPAKNKQFTLLARAGRQVQEVYLTTTLDPEGIKKAVQRVLGRVP